MIPQRCMISTRLRIKKRRVKRDEKIKNGITYLYFVYCEFHALSVCRYICIISISFFKVSGLEINLKLQLAPNINNNFLVISYIGV